MSTCRAEDPRTGEEHGSPTGDGASVCATCAGKLRFRLVGIPDLLADLEVTLARQDRLGAPGPSADGTLMWKAAVPDAVWALGNVLTVWAREIAERNSVEIVDPQPRYIRGSASDHVVPVENTAGSEPRCDETGLLLTACAHCRDLPHLRVLPDDAVPARPQTIRPAPVLGRRPPSARESVEIAARWLTTNLALLRRDPEAHDAHDEITSAVIQAEAACSAPPLRLYVGPCDGVLRYEPELDDEGAPTGLERPVLCGEDLYCRPDFTAVTCTRCETTHSDMAARWRRALDRVRLYPATAAVIARHIGELYGVKIDRKRINQWHRREKIKPIDHDDEGSPRFRIGTVLDLAKQQVPAQQAG